MRISVFKGLTREQKETIGLLQVGTFLEYFDLMLYVHMAVVLNDIFFPPSDPKTASFLAAIAFCSTYVLRPFGALIFGWLGDTFGRKTTVIITTLIMSLSCFTMANIPTYAQIGLSATYIVTCCRMIQGLSSMGEIMGAIIYTTEITKPPLQYSAVALIVLSSSVGSMFALGTASLVTSKGLDWRLAFWVGTTIALVGSFARTRLRETPDFIDYKTKKIQELEKIKDENTKETILKKINYDLKKKKTPIKHLLAFFFVECSYPLVFFMTFIFFNPILRNFGYSSHQIIVHNLWLAVFAVFLNALMVWLVSFVHPLKILTYRAIGTLFTFSILPLALISSLSIPIIILFQILLSLSRGGCGPGDSIFIKNLHVGKRFTLTTFNYALSRAVVHVISAFGLIALTNCMGYCGIWIIGIPFSLAYWWGVQYFKNVEKKSIEKTSDSLRVLAL